MDRWPALNHYDMRLAIHDGSVGLPRHPQSPAQAATLGVESKVKRAIRPANEGSCDWVIEHE